MLLILAFDRFVCFFDDLNLVFLGEDQVIFKVLEHASTFSTICSKQTFIRVSGPLPWNLKKITKTA